MSQSMPPRPAGEAGVAPTTGARPSPLRRRRHGRHFPPLRGLLVLVVLLALWQIRGDPNSPFYPPPSRWWESTEYLWNNGQLLTAVSATMQTFIVALTLATVIGASIGYWMGTFLHVDRALRPIVDFYRALPGVAMIPVFVLLIGYNLQMKIAVVTISGTFPVLLSTRSAALSSSQLLRDVAGTLKLSRWERLRKVALPSMVPAIIIGVHIVAPLILISTIVVEILTGVPGLGSLITEAQSRFRSADVYALALIAGLTGLFVNLITVWIGGYLLRYRPHAAVL